MRILIGFGTVCFFFFKWELLFAEANVLFVSLMFWKEKYIFDNFFLPHPRILCHYFPLISTVEVCLYVYLQYALRPHFPNPVPSHLSQLVIVCSLFSSTSTFPFG